MEPKKHANVGSSSSLHYDAHRFPSLTNAENFEELYAGRRVASERIITTDIMSTEEFGVIAHRGWKSLFTFDIIEINVDSVWDFYSDMIVEDDDFETFVRGKTIKVSLNVLASF